MDAGKSWTDLNMALGFDGLQESISSLAVYDGRLFAGANPNVYAFNGSTWTASLAVGASINAMEPYDGKLYAATNNSGVVYQFDGFPAVVAAYHPSRQNTNTGTLTPVMLRDVFEKVRGMI